MDTDISNYTYDEILNVLHLSKNDVTHELAYSKTKEMVDKIKGSEHLDEEVVNEYIGFFWECFQEVMRSNRYQISQPELYPGSLPKAIPETVSVNTNKVQYERGLVNPIKRETIKNTLIVSSKFATGKSSTDFSVTLNEPLSNVVALKVAGLELTNFFLNISKYLKNNHFSLHTYLRNTVTGEISNRANVKLEFQDGYYNLDTFTSNLQSQLDSNAETNMITTTYNILKGKVNFILKPVPPNAPPPDSEYGFDLDFANMASVKYYGIGWYLGFTRNAYLFSKDYSDGSDLNQDIGFNPERSLDLSGTKFFLLEVTDFNNNSPQVLLYNTKYTSSDLMAKIPNTATLSTIIYDDSSDRVFKTRKYFGPVKLQKLRIRLLDEFGMVVHMNNADFSLTFEIESLDIPYEKMVH
jgi:hypothetical protein